ncbi:hypothetical protein CRUP_022102 [Coryphaenoides rupestris]|nr:hypothetical protein CRUP_022102 [Coryphaenoides rupestris]
MRFSPPVLHGIPPNRDAHQVSRRAQPAAPPRLGLTPRDPSDLSRPGGAAQEEEVDLFKDEEEDEDEDLDLYLGLDSSRSVKSLGAKLSDTRISTVEEEEDGVWLSPRTSQGDGAGVSEGHGEVQKRSAEEEEEEEEEEVDRTRGRGDEEEKEKEEEVAAARERAAQRQMLAIEELVHTERNYLRLLQVASVTIRSNLQKIQPPLAGLSSMFLHVEEVMDVSSRLLSLLDQKLVKPGDPQYLQTLCDSFLSLSSDIEEYYKEYLANYNQVTNLENVYKQKEALWCEIVKVIKDSAPEVNATSLSFFLVMPVQRIARYPLLLQTIHKHTEPAHPAYARLEEAAHTAIALNWRINEYKRFREVADKYKKTETLSIKDKINRLNSHSIAKKTARLSQFIKHETGMAPKLVDEEFDALEMFFYLLEKGILELHDNVEAYLHHLQEKRMRSLIYKPLCSLRDLLAGPRNLIRKRLDKLLDYEMIEARPNLNYEEQAIASTYKTINTLLLNELPQFNGLALGMMWSLPHSSLEPGAFWEWVEHAVLEGARNLEHVCCTVEETLSSPIVQVTGAVVGTRDLDLSLGRGELVAIVSPADSRGDKKRWLVDAGGPRGYVPSSKLIRYHQAVEDPPPSPHLMLPVDRAGPRRHSYSPETRTLTLPAMSRPCIQVFVSYDFTARGVREVSVRAGEPVRVLESHDKGGNSQWSLVEAAHGRRGYVPSNYLVHMPTTPIGLPTTPGAMSGYATYR